MILYAVPSDSVWVVCDNVEYLLIFVNPGSVWSCGCQITVILLYILLFSSF